MAATRKKKAPFPPAKFKDYVEALASYCQGITWHGEYRRRIFYEKTQYRDDHDSPNETNASVCIDHVYLSVDMYIYPPLVRKWREEKYERVGTIVLHEFCHLYLHPIRHLHEHEEGATAKKLAQETVERQTVRIQNSIADMLPQDWYEPAVVAEKMKQLRKGRIAC